MLYSVIIVLKSGKEKCLESNDYGSMHNTFFFYAEQKSLFNIDEIIFVNSEYPDDSIWA